MAKLSLKKKMKKTSKKFSVIHMVRNQPTSNTFWCTKSMRRLVMQIAILLCIVTWQEANGATFINGMYYVLNTSKNTASLASATGEYGNFGGYAGDIVIPSSVVYQDVTYRVTSIQNRCFYNCKDITSISIPASITRINGTEVFYGCTGIKRIILEDGDNPITIPGCVYSTQLGNTKATFHYAKLESIYVGRTIKMSSSSDFDSPFYGQSSLSEVVIGPKVSELPRGFIYGSAVSNLSLPEGITTIGNYALAYMPNLDEIIFPNSLEEIGWGCCAGSAIENAFVGDNVKILEGTFHSCPNLKSVYLGSGLTTIGANAFAWSNNLSKIYLFSDNLTTLDSPGFSDGLSQIFVNNPGRYQSLFPDKHLDKLIVFNNSASIYTGSIPMLNYQNNVEKTTVSYSIPNEYINVGSYNIYIPVSFQYKNWTSQTRVSASYVIDYAQLTVIPQNVSRQYGSPNPEFTCSFFGFKNNETVAVLTKLPEVETTATTDSSVGTYPIIPSGAEAQNYTFNYERGILTITKADQIIEWKQQFGTVNVGDVIELNATSSADLPIKYTSSDESIAEIFAQEGKKYVEFLKPGSITLRANQDGNENYNEAERVSKAVNVDMLVSGISLNQKSATLAEGNSLQLIATVEPYNASNKSLTWESANPDIAIVNANGKVSALKQGSTIITVKTTDGSNRSAQCELTVVKLVDGVTINISTATLSEGQSLQLEVLVSPENASNKKLEWTSSNEAVAKVSQEGKVSAISKGSAIITAKTVDGSNVSASCSVNVIKLVTDIVLSETEMTLNEGQSATIIATVNPDLANNKILTWESSNIAVATVNQDGKVTAVSKGSAIITAKSTDGSNISASCTINVVKLVSGIVLSESEMSLNEGSTAQLTAIVSADANNPSILWTSSNETVATVSQDGKVTAIAKGVAIITAKATDGSGISASCTVNVVKLVNGIILSKTEMTLIEGESATLTATVTPDLANNKIVVWTSSNEAIATVDAKGVISAHLQGNAIISVTSTDGSNISASCNVTVVKLVSSIDINNTKINMKIGEQTTINAYALPLDATNPLLRWYSEDENVATVENGLVTAVGTGATYICVESTDGSDIVEKCEIEVEDPSGIDSISSQIVRVYVADGVINISNVPTNQTINIFLTNGTLVRSELSNGNLMTFQPSASGIYIVVVGADNYKVVIR